VREIAERKKRISSSDKKQREEKSEERKAGSKLSLSKVRKREEITKV